MNLFVGGLGPDVTDEDLRAAFEPFGKVDSAVVIMDRASNRSRGFGFVEMPNGVEARRAVEALSGRHLIKGKVIMVNEARPKQGGRRGGGRRW